MADVEKAVPAAPAEGAAGDSAGGGSTGVVGAALRRWRAQDALERYGSALRAGAWALSLLAFLVMACNEHGDWKQFDRYEEYRSAPPPLCHSCPAAAPLVGACGRAAAPTPDENCRLCQVHRGRRAPGLRLHDAAAAPARRPTNRRPGPAAQDRPHRRLRRGPGQTHPPRRDRSHNTPPALSSASFCDSRSPPRGIRL